MEIFVAALLIVSAFYLLAVLTEDFFVPSIDKIAAKLKMSSDASGATLLAMGSSAPEFFIALFAVLGFVSGATGDVGVGTIVGSAMFNVLVIVGVSAMYRTVKLQWQPVMRDLLFYVFTILLLVAAFWDSKIVWYEALGFVLMYGVYVYATLKWRRWFKYEDIPFDVEVTENKANRLGRTTRRLLSFFVPDPRKRPRLYLVTFLVSIAAIGVLSWLLVDQVVVIAEAWNVNPTFLALTILAAGTSVPDMVGSMVVARQGRGDMAVSNAIGSNVFNVLFGLGLPWLIALWVMGNDDISVSTDNLLSSVLLLLATVVSIVFLLLVRNWRIGHKSGLVLVGLYVAYCVYIAFSLI